MGTRQIQTWGKSDDSAAGAGVIERLLTSGRVRLATLLCGHTAGFSSSQLSSALEPRGLCMCEAPSLSQHMFPGGPTVGDLWAACSPPALISSARANLLTPPVWRLLMGRWPRLVWRRNTAKSLHGSAVTKLQPLKGLSHPPACQSGTRSPCVRLSARLPWQGAGGGGARSLLRWSLIPPWGTRGYYKSP